MRWSIFLVLAIAAGPVSAQDTHDDTGHADGEMMGEITLDTAPFRQDLAITCTFVSECVENEPCTETEFTPEINGIAGGLSSDDLIVQSHMVTDAETVELIGIKAGKALSLAGGGFAARHLLTIAGDGATRYTVHYAEGPFVISYIGTCE